MLSRVKYCYGSICGSVHQRPWTTSSNGCVVNTQYSLITYPGKDYKNRMTLSISQVLLQQQRLTPSFAGARCPHLFWHTTIFVPKDSPFYCKICFNLSPHCVLFLPLSMYLESRYLHYSTTSMTNRAILSEASTFFPYILASFLDTLFSRHSSLSFIAYIKHSDHNQ